MPRPIQYWNRASQRLETEQVYGDAWVKRIYGGKAGQIFSDALLSKPFFSKFVGIYQSSALSAGKIAPFVRDFRIPMEEFEERPYSSFNDFFIRRFKPGARLFTQDPSRLAAPCEARYFAWKRVDPEQKIPVKGRYLTPELLLKDHEAAPVFRDGPMLLARLCPVDYHRFHFPDDGRVSKTYHLPGMLHSVNPMALRYRGDIFSVNERQVSVLETRNFGKLAYIEVGALCVGRIVQTHDGSEFKRGEEKGYFLFGGSTVILLGEKDAWTPDADILSQTEKGFETWVRLGDGIAAL